MWHDGRGFAGGLLALLLAGCAVAEDSELAGFRDRDAQLGHVQLDLAWAIDAAATGPSPEPVAVAEASARAAFSADAKRILVQHGATLHLLSPSDGAVIPVPTDGEIVATAMSPRGDLLAVWTEASLHIVRLADASEVSTLALEADEPMGGALTFSWDGSRIAATTGRIWDTRSGRALVRFANEGHSLAWSDDGRYLVSTGFTVQMFDANTGKEVLRDGGGCGGLATSPNGMWSAFSVSQHDLTAWPRGGRPTATLLSARGCTGHHISPQFTADSRHVWATGGGLFGAYETGTWRLIGYYAGPFDPQSFENNEEVVAVSPDASRVVVQRVDQSTFVWDAARLRKVTELPLAAGRVVQGFSPDGRRLLTVAGGVAEILSATNGERLLSAVYASD